MSRHKKYQRCTESATGRCSVFIYIVILFALGCPTMQGHQMSPDCVFAVLSTSSALTSSPFSIAVSMSFHDGQCIINHEPLSIATPWLHHPSANRYWNVLQLLQKLCFPFDQVRSPWQLARQFCQLRHNACNWTCKSVPWPCWKEKLPSLVKSAVTKTPLEISLQRYIGAKGFAFPEALLLLLLLLPPTTTTYYYYVVLPPPPPPTRTATTNMGDLMGGSFSCKSNEW